jgi:hypothetical protein
MEKGIVVSAKMNSNKCEEGNNDKPKEGSISKHEDK